MKTLALKKSLIGFKSKKQRAFRRGLSLIVDTLLLCTEEEIDATGFSFRLYTHSSKTHNDIYSVRIFTTTHSSGINTAGYTAGFDLADNLPRVGFVEIFLRCFYLKDYYIQKKELMDGDLLTGRVLRPSGTVTLEFSSGIPFNWLKHPPQTYNFTSRVEPYSTYRSNSKWVDISGATIIPMLGESWLA